MKKKSLLTLVFSIVVISFMLAGFYLGLAGYYSGGFGYGIWVNGVYCTGRSVEEIDAALKEQFEETEFEVLFEDGTKEKFALQDISYEIDYKRPLRVLQDTQNPYHWFGNLKKRTGNTIVPEITFDEAELTETIEGFTAVKAAEKIKEQEVKIVKTGQGYVLLNRAEHILDKEQLIFHVENALKTGKYQMETSEECYKDVLLTRVDEKLLSLWEKLKVFQSCEILYDMGDETVCVDASVVCDWLTVTEQGEPYLNEEGELVLDENKLKDFVNRLAEEYDTLGKEREFQATRGDTVTIEGGTYGSKLNKQAEIAYLTDAFLAGKKERHVPEYIQEAYFRGKDDIGDTYIEIDMTEQQMYYYVDGEIYEQAPIVTGNMVRNMSTPEGICFVYAKQKNRVLRGSNYASFVNFWVPVRGNIGIHDAPWRSSYGEEIYKTNGSHGCINTPYEEMKNIYEHVEIGTPVVMFY